MAYKHHPFPQCCRTPFSSADVFATGSTVKATSHRERTARTNCRFWVIGLSCLPTEEFCFYFDFHSFFFLIRVSPPLGKLVPTPPESGTRRGWIGTEDPQALAFEMRKLLDLQGEGRAGFWGRFASPSKIEFWTWQHVGHGLQRFLRGCGGGGGETSWTIRNPLTLLGPMQLYA